MPKSNLLWKCVGRLEIDCVWQHFNILFIFFLLLSLGLVSLMHSFVRSFRPTNIAFLDAKFPFLANGSLIFDENDKGKICTSTWHDEMCRRTLRVAGKWYKYMYRLRLAKIIDSSSRHSLSNQASNQAINPPKWMFTTLVPEISIQILCMHIFSCDHMMPFCWAVSFIFLQWMFTNHDDDDVRHFLYAKIKRTRKKKPRKEIKKKTDAKVNSQMKFQKTCLQFTRKTFLPTTNANENQTNAAEVVCLSSY